MSAARAGGGEGSGVFAIGDRVIVESKPGVLFCPFGTDQWIVEFDQPQRITDYYFRRFAVLTEVIRYESEGDQ